MSELKSCLKSEHDSDSILNLRNTSQTQQMDDLTSESWSCTLDWQDTMTVPSVLHGNFPQGDSNGGFPVIKRAHFPHHIDAEAPPMQLPSPDEASTHHTPTGLDLQQRLLDLDRSRRSDVFEHFQGHLHSGNPSYPPAAYYLSTPPGTPNDTFSPHSTLFPERSRSNANRLGSPKGDGVSPRDNDSVYSTTPTRSIFPPVVDDYYRNRTADSGHVDLDLLDAQRSREPPYAELLYQCLLAAPGHQMVLKDIYEWFRQNTDKTDNPDVKGWMNSIRHNLSMNQGFEKVEQASGEDGRRGYVWRLSERAFRDGIQSTTRYRKKPPTGKHNGGRSRRNSLVSGGRVSKSSRIRRSARIQTSFMDEELVEYHDFDGPDGEEMFSPSNYIATAPSTPRGYVALPSGSGSPMGHTIQSSPELALYEEAFSPFSPSIEIPRSDPHGMLRYSMASAPTSHPASQSDLRTLGYEAHGQQPDGPSSAIYSCSAYPGNDSFTAFSQSAHVVTSDTLPPFERTASGAGAGIFSLPQFDCIHTIYSDGSESVQYLAES